MRWIVSCFATFALATLSFVSPGQAAGEPLLPDLETVVPKHLALWNQQQRELLRFSNGIANTGEGHLRFRPDPPPGSQSDVTNAVQELLDANGNVAHEEVVGTFAYHSAHNHWHIGDVARFEVRSALDDGTGGAMGDTVLNDRGAAVSVKTTFCIIDWYKLGDNANTKERAYWSCETSYQGIQPGWVDQYHQSIEGQELDITGAPAGLYYLASTSNPDCLFVESECANNSAWTSFRLSRESSGNAKLEVVANSPCASPGMCGEQAVNR